MWGMKTLSLHEVEHTQGTVHLISDDPALQRKDGFVLVPQPNREDPNDPLRWGRSRRTIATYVLLFFTAMNNFAITGIAPGFGQIVGEFGSNNSQLTYLIALPSLGEGLGCFTIAPLALRFGKRPLWLGCATLYFVCEIWAAVSKSYGSLLVARFLASWSAGAVEPMSADMVNDLYFLHERGTLMGIQGLFLTLGATFSPVVCGFLIEAKGWRWYHWLCTILGGASLLAIFLLVPETQYRRDLHQAMDKAGTEGDGAEQSDGAVSTQEEFKEATTQVESQASVPNQLAKKSYGQHLKPWSAPNKDVSLLAAYIRPWMLWTYPSVAWGIFSFAIHISSFTVLLSLLPIYLSEPPYSFSTTGQGLLYLGPCIGALGGCFLGGYVNDAMSHFSSRRNEGIHEPEMRLPAVLFPGILGPVGLILFGKSVTQHYHWIVPVVADSLVCGALTACPSAIQPYLMDSYFPVALDVLVVFNGFKNFVGFGIGFAAVPWLEQDGLVAMFCTLAAITLVIDGFGILIYIYGKRLRKRDAGLKIFPF